MSDLFNFTIPHVSRETNQRLQEYVASLLKWTPAINLIGKSTEKEIWQRHICESTVLFGFMPKQSQHWLDLGSGGGLPGVVISILALEKAQDLTVTLVESDQRKAVFLEKTIRDLSLKALVLNERIEVIPQQGADVISARALAPLGQLLEYSWPHMAESCVLLFPKGRTYKSEIEASVRKGYPSPQVHHADAQSDGAVLEYKIGEHDSE